MDLIAAWPLGGRGPATFWVVVGLVPLVGLGVVCYVSVKGPGGESQAACVWLALDGSS